LRPVYGENGGGMDKYENGCGEMVVKHARRSMFMIMISWSRQSREATLALFGNCERLSACAQLMH
jgi:hypothetical protein